MEETTVAEGDDVYLEEAVSIVIAYVTNNSVPAAGLPGLISTVHVALSSLRVAADPEQIPLVPPVSIKKSMTSAYLISLEDGRRYKSLKRHLGGRGLTPDEYRQKWNLPRDYPMVAPDYAAKRSELAKASGLGRKGAAATAEPKGPPRPRGRPRKASLA